MNYDKWLNHTFSSSVSTLPDYIEFQKEMRSDLRKMAKANNLTLNKFIKNHYEFSAILKDLQEDKFIYVRISDVRHWKNEWYNRVLIRTMENESDTTGGSNNYCSWQEVGEKARELVDFMKHQEKNYDLDLEPEIE